MMAGVHAQIDLRARRSWQGHEVLLTLYTRQGQQFYSVKCGYTGTACDLHMGEVYTQGPGREPEALLAFVKIVSGS